MKLLGFRLQLLICTDEGVAAGKNTYNGEPFEGIPIYEEIMTFNRKVLHSTMPLQFINWKARNLGTYRNLSSRLVRKIRSDNYIWLNSIDAKRRNLKHRDEVKIINKDLQLVGTVAGTEGISPGVVGSAYKMGQTVYGVTRNEIEGKKTEKLPTYNHTPSSCSEPMYEESGYAGGREEGFVVNRLTEADPSIKKGVLLDEIRDSPGQLNMYVEIKKL